MEESLKTDAIGKTIQYFSLLIYYKHLIIK